MFVSAPITMRLMWWMQRSRMVYFGNNQEFDAQEDDINDKPRIRMLLQKGYDPVLNINDGGVHYFRKAK